MRSRVRAHVFLALLAPGAAASACFYGWDLQDGAGTVDGGGDATTDTGGTDAIGNDGKPGVDSGGDGGADGSGGDGTVPPLLCIAPGACGGPAATCIFSDHLCGKGVKNGTCTKPPQFPCAASSELWCGCDGKLYPTECALYLATTDLNATAGGCAADAGYFQCGYVYCARASQFCESTPAANSYKCVDWSMFVCAGGNQDCTCAKMACQATGCTQVAAGGPLTLTCQ